MSWDHLLVDKVEVSKKTFTAFRPNSKCCQIEELEKEFDKFETCTLCRKYTYDTCLSENDVTKNVDTDKQKNGECDLFWNNEKAIVRSWKTGIQPDRTKSVLQCIMGFGLPKTASFCVNKIFKALFFAFLVRMFDALIEKYEPEVDVAHIGAEAIGALVGAFVIMGVALFKLGRKRVNNGRLYRQNWDDLKIDSFKVRIFAILVLFNLLQCRTLKTSKTTFKIPELIRWQKRFPNRHSKFSICHSIETSLP